MDSIVFQYVRLGLGLVLVEPGDTNPSPTWSSVHTMACLYVDCEQSLSSRPRPRYSRLAARGFAARRSPLENLARSRSLFSLRSARILEQKRDCSQSSLYELFEENHDEKPIFRTLTLRQW